MSKIRIQPYHDTEDTTEVLLGIRKILTVRDGKEPTVRYMLRFCGLTDREIKVYFARLFDERTFKSIGLEIGTCPNNVSTILSKSLRKIRGFWARNYEWDQKEKTKMEREEKIAALFREVCGEPKETDMNLYKLADWKSIRMECKDEEEVNVTKREIVRYLAYGINALLQGPGVFDVVFSINRISDYDDSPEGDARRAAEEVEQKRVAEAIQAGMAEIDSQEKA